MDPRKPASLGVLAAITALVPCTGFVVACAGAAPVATASDPGALAALASPLSPQLATPPSASSSAPPAPPASSGVTSAMPSATASASATEPHPPAAPASTFDPSRPRHLLQGVVTGPSGRPAANAVVYLTDAPVEPGRGDKAAIDQRNMQFIPFLVAIAQDGKVTFANGDPFPHNVYSVKPERFDFGMVPQNSSRSRVFKKPGAYQILCNLHPNMIAYVYVAPSSYFATTNAQGKYAIKDVPEGAHAIGVWAQGGLESDAISATVGAGDAALDIALHKAGK